jgi:vancomycin resistance protein YoaR
MANLRVEAGAGVSQHYLRRRRQARARRIRRIAFAATGLALGGLVLASVLYAGSPDRLAGGLKIVGVDVGGLEADDARRLLEQRAAAVARKPVVFTVSGQRFRIRPVDLGLRVDWGGAVASARAEGDGFAPLRGVKRIRLRLFGDDVSPKARYDGAKLRAELAAISRAVDRPHHEAALELRGLKVVVVPAQQGNVIDRRQAVRTILGALTSFQRNAPVTLPMRSDPPRVTAATLAPALREARIALSKPVRLTLGATAYRIPRWRIAEMLRLPKNGAKELRIAGAGATAFFKRLEKVVNAPPKDAQFIVYANGVRIQPSKDGRMLDVPKTADALLASALRVLPARRTAAIVVGISHPKRTTEDAKKMGITGVVGSYTTYYGGVPNRIHNVQLVSRLIDNHLIPPGKEFSFNGTTGERSADKGFLEAPVIINGELQTGLGGGVCQVSTTVFNSAYEAGLPITARTNHALYISHYPQGRDATVDYPSTDLKFVNDTDHWLLLRAFVSASSLTVNLYGAPQHRKVESTTSELRETGPAPIVRKPDPTMLKGKRVIEESGSPSRATSVTRRVYASNGKLLYENTWYSSYRAEKKVIRYGTKPKPKPKPKPVEPLEPSPFPTDFTIPPPE